MTVGAFSFPYIFIPLDSQYRDMGTSQATTNSQLQSKTISFLRFPLIVLVVLIHTQINSINGISSNDTITNPFSGAFPIYESNSFLFSQIIARIAVPLFFFISGFLFFYKTPDFSLSTYAAKLKKRIFRLLIPYLIWNILFILSRNLPAIISHGSSPQIIGEGYSITDWISAFWCYNSTESPVSYQLWFIRDLMVVVLFTPLIYWLIKNVGYLLPSILGIFWITQTSLNIVGFSTEAFFFFSVGSYFSINKRNFTELVKSHTTLLGIIYLLFVIITFLTKDFSWSIYLKRISILIGTPFAIAISASLIEQRKWRVNRFLDESSFFIYAYHIIVLPIVFRFLTAIIPCTSDIRATILYFLWATTVIGVGLIIYYCMERCLPKTTALITGGK